LIFGDLRPAVGVFASDKPFRHKGSTLRREVLTRSWSTGDPGPIAYCLPEGTMKSSEMTEFNKKHHGYAMVFSSTTDSHFMTGETLCMVYEQLYSPALALQRKRLNVGREAKAAVICDAWTGTLKKTDGLALRSGQIRLTTKDVDYDIIYRV